jgi:hypothetical protein
VSITSNAMSSTCTPTDTAAARAGSLRSCRLPVTTSNTRYASSPVFTGVPISANPLLNVDTTAILP